MAKSIIKDKSYEFALRTINLSKSLKKEKEFEFAGQLMRSGTSIGANVEEALAGQIKKTLSPKCILLLKRLVKLIIGSGFFEILLLFRAFGLLH